MSDVLLRTINGVLGSDTTLSFDTNNIANSGENLVTELAVQLPSEILTSYRIYFEFLLPTKERYISEPLTAAIESVPTLDEFNNPIVGGKQVAVVRYKIPRYPTMGLVK